VLSGEQVKSTTHPSFKGTSGGFTDQRLWTVRGSCLPDDETHAKRAYEIDDTRENLIFAAGDMIERNTPVKAV